MDYHILEDYYFDIDDQHQFRIAGPGNHLLIGFSVLHQSPFHIEYYTMENGQLVVDLRFAHNQVSLSHPLVCDIRTLRSFTEGQEERPNYHQLAQRSLPQLLPKSVDEREEEDGGTHIIFSRNFENEQGLLQRYGAILEVPSGTTASFEENRINISSEEPVKLTIRTIAHLQIKESLLSPIFTERQTLPALEQLSPFLQDLYQETGRHISHLVRAKKTSSFEYGTIFPRDWIESAQLGEGDLSQDSIDFMYQQSLKHVSSEGVGWHEEAIGEYRYLRPENAHVDRKMVDIEPLYILGIDQVSKQFVLNNQNAHRLKAIGRYILKQAQNHSLITFKKKREAEDEYYEVGNWRDSTAAFPHHEPPLAPYDVNCVFYPQALQILGDYREFFNITQIDQLDQLVEAWQEKKERFLVHFSEGLHGYSLALQGKPFRPLSVAHLDESYDLFYGTPSMEDTLSFASRMLSPDYFYTPVGPILVAATTEHLTRRHYHGKVIWPKQAAFAVAGLARQYRYGRKSGWPEHALKHVYDAITETAESCFKGWEDLGAVTELYYYDKSEERARFYLDQEEVEGQMSVIQLWSAVGARRIIREYLAVQRLAQQPLDIHPDTLEPSSGS